MTQHADTWLMLTPKGVLHAFADAEPGAAPASLQTLVSGSHALSRAEWNAVAAQLGVENVGALFEQACSEGWINVLRRQVPGPDVRLDDFARHVIAPLSGERRAVLASDGGFCLGQSGVEQDEADALSVAAADFSAFARRQSARGWRGAERYVSFFSDSHLLLPDWSFIPFWVDGSCYWLIVAGEPLLNNLARVELVWSIRLAANRFQPPQ